MGAPSSSLPWIATSVAIVALALVTATWFARVPAAARRSELLLLLAHGWAWFVQDRDAVTRPALYRVHAGGGSIEHAGP